MAKHKKDEGGAVRIPPLGRIAIEESPGRGRGVFARGEFKRGDLIERVPVILVPAKQRQKLDETDLYNYAFEWEEVGGTIAIALGYGSLYNHSYRPNAAYNEHPREEVMDFYAIKTIRLGQEITVNYNGEPDDQEPLWFDVV